MIIIPILFRRTQDFTRSLPWLHGRAGNQTWKCCPHQSSAALNKLSRRCVFFCTMYMRHFQSFPDAQIKNKLTSKKEKSPAVVHWQVRWWKNILCRRHQNFNLLLFTLVYFYWLLFTVIEGWRSWCSSLQEGVWLTLPILLLSWSLVCKTGLDFVQPEHFGWADLKISALTCSSLVINHCWWFIP